MSFLSLACLPPHIYLRVEEMEASDVDESYYPCTSTTQSDTERKSYDKKYYSSRNRCEHTENTEEHKKYPNYVSHNYWKFFNLLPIGRLLGLSENCFDVFLEESTWHKKILSDNRQYIVFVFFSKGLFSSWCTWTIRELTTWWTRCSITSITVSSARATALIPAFSARRTRSTIRTTLISSTFSTFTTLISSRRRTTSVTTLTSTRASSAISTT